MRRRCCGGGPKAPHHNAFVVHGCCCVVGGGVGGGEWAAIGPRQFPSKTCEKSLAPTALAAEVLRLLLMDARWNRRRQSGGGGERVAVRCIGKAVARSKTGSD